MSRTIYYCPKCESEAMDGVCHKCEPPVRVQRRVGRIGRPTTLGTPSRLSVSDPKTYRKLYRQKQADKIRKYFKEWSKTHKRGKFSWGSMAHACRLAAKATDNPHLRDTLNCAASIFDEVGNSPNDDYATGRNIG